MVGDKYMVESKLVDGNGWDVFVVVWIVSLGKDGDRGRKYVFDLCMFVWV